MGFAKSFTESFNQSYGIAAKTRAQREESEYEWSMKTAFERKKERAEAEKAETKAQSDARIISEQTGKPLKDVYERVKASGYDAAKDWAQNTIGGDTGVSTTSNPQSIHDEAAGLGIAASESPVDRLLGSEAQAPANSEVNQPTLTANSGGYRPKPVEVSFEKQKDRYIQIYATSNDPEKKAEAEQWLKEAGVAKDLIDPPQITGRTKVDLTVQIATEKDPQRKSELQASLDQINEEEANQGKLTAGPVRGVAVVNGELQPTMIEARRGEDGRVQYFLAGTQTPAEGARATDDQETREAQDLGKISERPEVQKQNEKVVALTSGLRSSARLQALVDKDENILQPVTGKVVDVLDAARKEFAAATSLLGVELERNVDENGVVSVSGASMRALEEKVNSIDFGKVTDTAELRDLFNAEMSLLAYRMGVAEGQSGNAFSEKDFNRISAGLRGSTSAEAFKTNLNGYMSGQLRSVSDSGALLDQTNRQIQRFQAQYGYNPVGVFPSPESFIAERTVDNNGQVIDPELAAGYAAAKGAKPFSGINDKQGSGTPNDPVRNKPNAVSAPSSRHIEALRANPNMADQFDRKFGPGSAARILGNQ